MNLFQKGDFTLHSGKKSNFKIECDALTNEDWECIAFMISNKFKFYHVVGVPSGGLKLATALQKYCTTKWNQTILIVDDVLTTGKSMEETKIKLINDPTVFVTNYEFGIKGVVVFARGQCPEWITPIFQMNI